MPFLFEAETVYQGFFESQNLQAPVFVAKKIKKDRHKVLCDPWIKHITIVSDLLNRYCIVWVDTSSVVAPSQSTLMNCDSILVWRLVKFF